MSMLQPILQKQLRAPSWEVGESNLAQREVLRCPSRNYRRPLLSIGWSPVTFVSRAIHVAILGITDLLAEGPGSCDE